MQIRHCVYAIFGQGADGMPDACCLLNTAQMDRVLCGLD